jgi:hypothetical protein
VSLEIIGAGLGRTGTMSLKVALETLGFGPCYHMTEVFENPEHVPLWRAAMRGERVGWESIFGRYRAAVDYPAASFYRELMEHYPDAKVILTVRDPERWYESARSTIYNVRRAARSPLVSIPARFVPRLRGLRAAAVMAGDLVWDREFEGRFEDHEYAIETFNAHNEEVERLVPPEKLLVYEVKEGWGPLCEFLGVPVPDEPFPRLNDAAAFRRRIRTMQVASAAAVVLPALALAYLLVRRARGAR